MVFSLQNMAKDRNNNFEMLGIDRVLRSEKHGFQSSQVLESGSRT